MEARVACRCLIERTRELGLPTQVLERRPIPVLRVLQALRVELR
jgi:hypothetical protein